MSHFAVHISTDGAAFADGNRNIETARLLRELADNLEIHGDVDLLVRLRDVNGNRVGFATFNAPDEELV